MSAPPDFEQVYRQNADPWRVDTSFYEQRKLSLVLATLGRPTYAFAWDPACGTGHLAVRLSERSGRVLATDVSATATALTRTRCQGLDNVQVAEGALPDPPPPDHPTPDLIVLSEVFYYLDDVVRQHTLAMIDEVAAPGCEVLAVHWRHVPDDAWLGGMGAQHEIVSRLQQRRWIHRSHHLDEDFVLDTLTRKDV